MSNRVTYTTEPLFSFVIPVHNGMPYIQECIQSILDQKYKNFEIQVLENKSSDGTSEYLKSIEDNSQITIIRAKKLLNLEENWARIISLKTCEFMIITCADDSYTPEYLSVMVELINKHPNASLYRTQINFISSESKVLFKAKKMREKLSHFDYIKGRLSHTYCETIMGYCFRSKDYNKVGGIDCIHKLMHPDDVLFIKLGMLSYIAISPKYAANYRKNKNSISATVNTQVAIAGYNYFFDWLKSLNNEKINCIVRNNLHIHLFNIKSFFSDAEYNEIEKQLYNFNINPNSAQYIKRMKKLERRHRFITVEPGRINVRFFCIKISFSTIEYPWLNLFRK